MTQPSRPGSESDLLRVLNDDGSLDAAHKLDVSIEQRVELYRAMVRTRLIDERLVRLQRQGRVGFHIGSLGEEATVIGSAFAMRPQDFLFPAYREFGAALVRGFELQRYIDNMFGNANDPAHGRQMPDHYTCAKARFGSVSSPIGTQITHAVGYAWAAKMRGDDVVTLAYFGEGATSSSEFHNGLNFAGVFRTPTVFLCRNNGWAISVPPERQTASEGFAAKAHAYGIKGVRCDGNDALAVMLCTGQAVERAARGEGSTLIEALTYRMAGHSTSDDPTIYRSAEMLEPWRNLDPLQRMRRHLDTLQAWDDARQEELEKQTADELGQAIDRAEAAGAPALESMFDDVYGEMPWNLQEQRAQLLGGARVSKGH